jgi:predicted peroxiredoxin
MACAPCLESRKLSAPDDLRPEVEIIGAARLVAEIMSATATLTY